MYYTIYKITNSINNKIYIGKHQTNNLDDGYMGSGKHLRRAISKHGPDKFQKEILFVFETESEMNEKEREIVTEEFVQRKDTYNICVGGQGGFSYINENQLNVDIIQQRLRNPEIIKKSIESAQKKFKLLYLNDNDWILKYKTNLSYSLKEHYENGGLKPFLGKHHTEESKRKIGEANSKHQSGNGNSQFGTMWITNGIENRKIKKDLDMIPEGWYKGRKL